MKIVTIVGARPQFIKVAAVNRAIESFNRGHSSHSTRRIQEILVHTGQHYDYLMDTIFFEQLELPRPDYHLDVGSGSHGRQTGMMLERIETVLMREKPGMAVVYGDTNSTLAGALAAAKLNIPVAHVEAGLRSYNRVMPEEVNRLLTDHLSTLLLCPTSQAVRNLSKEGIRDGGAKAVLKVGDVMYDSILYYSEVAERRSTILKDLGLFAPHSNPLSPNSLPAPRLRQAGALRTPNYYLATLHRAENTDHPKRLKSILKALKEIGKDLPVILPLHPRTRKMMKAYHLLPVDQRIRLIDPVSYLDMIMLEKNAEAILTDSGGIQKEAYWLSVPCLTLREETEWVETVQSGWNLLVGTEAKRILEGVSQLQGRKRVKGSRGMFGDGRAGEKIVRTIMKCS